MKVDDPYRWLEDAKTPAVQAWMAAQDGVARAALHALPRREAIASRLKELMYLDRLGAPAKRNWWLALILPLLAVANIATAFVIIPEEHVGVGLVLDAYLFNGLLTVVLIVLLLKRSVRAYFGVSRPPAHVRAA